jgi:phosphohistidine phosphatase
LITSPLVRARQTADLIAEGFPETRRFEWDELAPGGEPEALCGQLLNHRIDSGVTALVGHEPDLGELGGWLLTGDRCCDFMPLKKGSALLLELAEEKPGPGCAILRWLFTPAQLRMLGSACG